MRVVQGAADSAAIPFFRGATRLALAAKGRLAIPTRHREALVARGGRSADAHPLVLTVDPRFADGFENGRGRRIAGVWRFLFRREGTTGTFRALVDAASRELVERAVGNANGSRTGPRQ